MKLQQYYEAQTTLLRLERRSAALTEALKQAKFDLRCTEEALLNYQGSARGFLDKLSGKREEREETLHREIRKAKATMQSFQQEKEALNHKIAELTQTLQSFPSCEALRLEKEQEWASLEVKFCAEALTPLLEGNHQSLLKYRSLIRGEYPIISVQKQQEIYSEPTLWAEQCKPYLLRLKEAMYILGMPFSLGRYYESPVAYLVNVAADHNRRDRVNQALDQVEEIQRRISNFK